MIILLLLASGIFLSAFFSGSETGFYRVTRVRLLMDSKSGSWIARSLLWLVERPSLVVATVLIGNNIANYLVSLGLVLASEELLQGMDDSLQTFVPVLATPLLFIYGELLPKYMYFNAPYFLSTRGAPLMVFCAALFLPLSILVLGLESLWQRVSGAVGTQSKLSLERQQLQQVMMEGQEAGILLPVQRELAQNLFTYGSRAIRQFVLPVRAIPVVSVEASREEARKLAARLKQDYIAIQNSEGGPLASCYSAADLSTFSSLNAVDRLPVLQVGKAEAAIQVLMKMQASNSPLAQVNDDNGKPVGFVLRERLTSLLMSE